MAHDLSNELMDIVRKDLNAALDRESAIRVNYETGLIPQLERDLQASRRDVEALTTEVLSLRAYKARSEAALVTIDAAHKAVADALVLV